MFVNSLLLADNTLFLDEIQDQLSSMHRVKVSISTIKHTLDHMCISRKQVSKEAGERNDLLHAAFVNEVVELVPNSDMLLCVDESSKDDCTVARQWGYSCLGTRCIVREPFVCRKQYTILPVLGLDGYLSFDIFEGSVTAEIFERFLREHVVCQYLQIGVCSNCSDQAPFMCPYPGPRSVLLLDNCSIHHGPTVKTIIEDEAGKYSLQTLNFTVTNLVLIGGKLLFLLPYSPYFNPIKQSFLCIKAWLRHHYNEDLDKLTLITFMQCACDTITADKAHGWFSDSGYTM
jgi:transposase